MYLEGIGKNTLEYLSNYGPAIIAVCTVLYLFVTWRLLNENRKMYNAKYLPIITIKYDTAAKHFVASNIGEGLAISIKVGSFYVFVGDFHFCLVFDKIYNLKPNDSKILSFTEYVNGKRIDHKVLYAHLATSYGKRDYTFTLIVRDILNNIYYEQVNMGKSGIFILRHFKAWWLIRLYYFLKDKIKHLYFKYINKWLEVRKYRRKHASPNSRRI